jgi:glycosyltransferase involved in cell wall biosynthesis
MNPDPFILEERKPVGPTVCLIGPGHLASNPRLVKEADALSGAGYGVRVVSADYMAAIRPLDAAVLSAAPWQSERVPLGGWGRRWRAARRRACAWLADRGLAGPEAAAWAESEQVGRLAAAAAAAPADLYVGHYLPGLAAAARAARRHGAALGFDAEDSHVDELPDSPLWQGRRASRARIEAAWLPRCRHLTAASPLIAEALRRRYGVRPEVVLNVFPLKEAPPAPEPTAYQLGRGPATLYWFSQTIGPGRGIEAILEALARMRQPAHLHLRGLLAGGYSAALEALVNRLGLHGRLHLSGQAEPSQMALLSAPFDLGLALELVDPPNRALCLTNKIFTYLLAGVPVVLSRTPAQEEMAARLGPSALRVDLGDPAATAARLDAYLGDAAAQQAARQEAWRLGQDKYNWDVEQHIFLASVRQALGGPAGSPPQGATAAAGVSTGQEGWA